MKLLKLPVPIFMENSEVLECQITKPSSGTLLETRKIINTGDYFLALKKFLSETILFDDDKEKTLRLVGELPMNSAEYLTIQVLLLHHPDDAVEGVYYCPRCHTQKICEDKDGIDTSDKISELDVVYFGDSDSKEITKDVEVVLTDKKTGNTVFDCRSITMRFPKLKDFIESANKVGYEDEVEIQKQVYLQCVTKINNEEIDKKTKNIYLQKILYKLDPRNLNYFGSYINKFGMKKEVEKVCLKCSKKWDATINTSNFFDSALQ